MESILGREEHSGITIHLCKDKNYVVISVYNGNEGQMVKELIEVLRKYERQANCMEGEDEESFPFSS